MTKGSDTMGINRRTVGVTDDQRLDHFTAALSGPMCDVEWARDLAARLVAYDPLAAEYVGIKFMPGDRIVVSYRCDGPSRRIHTFVEPKWIKPA